MLTIEESWKQVEHQILRDYPHLMVPGNEGVMAAIATAHHLGYKNAIKRITE